MVNYKVVHTDKFGIETEVFPLSIRVTYTKEPESNIAEFIFKAGDVVSNGEYLMDYKDKFIVYAVQSGNNITEADDEVLGTMTLSRYEGQESGKTVTVICRDLTFTLLQNIYARKFDENSTISSPNLVANVVDTLSRDGLKPSQGTSEIDQLRPDGSSFPTFAYTTVYDTGYNVISDVSQTEYTGTEKSYLFYIKPNGYFVWTYPSSTIESQVFEYGKHPVLDMPTKFDESEVVNAVIYDAGVDLDGNRITGLINKPEIEGMLIFEPLTQLADQVRSDSPSITNNEDFVIEVKRRASAKVEYIFEKLGFGARTATVKVVGGMYQVGKKHLVKGETIPETEMTLDRIVHRIDKNGWKTDLEFTEER